MKFGRAIRPFRYSLEGKLYEVTDHPLRLVPYPCHVGSADAWGNLVAFLRALPEETLRMTAVQVLEGPALLPKSDDRTSIARESGAAARRPQENQVGWTLNASVRPHLPRP